MAHKAVNDKEQCSKASKAVSLGLHWAATVEGAEFWADVHSRLALYAEGGTPPKLGTATPAAKEPTFAEQAQQRIEAIKKGTAAAQDAAQTEN